ncbi:MAG: tRNA (adenosine(37)-N6)-threonylcarbamoyltransferase complex ATPase subunit type 1 TsaE [Clostridiales bacterium]|nr:tRNA (adenosine(37)-N6)-threonylcarbamoyltransferase complex ATPase subunit type 1 TsaE [Clostridiales bacterium]
MDLKTSSPEQTEQFAASFAALLKAGDIITLDGDLGAGKTCFTRGLVKGIGSDAMVSSPTFTIVNEYEGGRLNVYHFDTYRLGDSEEFLMSGLDEYFYQGGVSVIEWSSIITDIIPAGSIGIDITGNGDERYFSVDMPDDRYDALKTIIEEMGS